MYLEWYLKEKKAYEKTFRGNGDGTFYLKNTFT